MRVLYLQAQASPSIHSEALAYQPNQTYMTLSFAAEEIRHYRPL